MNAALFFVGVVLGVIRATGHKTQFFQAMAHLYMGGLIAAWWIGRDTLPYYGWLPLYGWLVVVLSIVEVICFFVFKGRNGTDKGRDKSRYDHGYDEG